MLDTIAQAIATKSLLAFNYDGENRLVEPHACGLTSQGKPVVRGYQPAGGTHRELGWKLFSVEKIQNLTVLPLTFQFARPGYVLGDRQMAEIVAQVDAVFQDQAA